MSIASDPRWSEALALLPDYLGSHVRVSMTALALGLAISLPLALLASSLTPTRGGYVIGAKTFAEQYVLASLLEQRLQAANLSATRREGLGSNVIFDALARDDIDVYVDYSGTLWANVLKRTDIKPREALLDELKAELASRWNVTTLGTLGFENAYALVMPRQRAEQLGIRSIADLASRAPTMTIAGDYEFFSRPEWAGLRNAYGLNFRQQRQMQPDFMYAAVASGEVDVIAGYTSDGAIAKFDLVVLTDEKNSIPPYDAMLLLSPKRTDDQALRDTLLPLIGRIDIATMREANLRAASNETPATVARWLWRRIGR